MHGNSAAPAAWLTAAEAARILKISPATLERMAHMELLRVQPSDETHSHFLLEDVLALAGQKQPEPQPAAERHACLLVRAPEKLVAALLPALVAPLANGVTVALILNQVKSRLEPLLAGLPGQQAQYEARFHPLEAKNFFLDDGRFDLTMMLNRLANLSLELGRLGQPLLFVAEISWLIHRQPNFELAEYETKLTGLLFEHSTLSALCVYDTGHCNGEVTLTALQTHAAAWVDGACRTGLKPLKRS